ncbi:uncharacterized protein STEHIDRAFT_141264 [Stereum hirsutum FP-91666 SS1]|uniref:uncharacterized protein n=1 Tax=Stereum hirsutum (strain FP-91666) TaxID=721885 RepID=UPI000444A535|nr:uncharacterized protein STEHIDRAFT_141264 [Stereum hirsutum FP-91666 SS1]EIM83546.1 hypothetical protein STEHIDRAFT_141264 [Stereum hirsutum FP-91666 SS1]
MSNTNRPNLSADALFYERAALIGGLASWMTFGMICVVCLQTVNLLVDDPPKRGRTRNKALIAFTFVMFTLAVSFVGLYTRNYQLEFIDNRDYPGGPMAWGRTQYGSARLASSNAIGVVISWLADGFLLYRCLVIFRFKLYLLIPLVLLFLANMGDRSPLSVISESFADLQLRETVSSIFFLYESMQPGSSLYSNNTVDWGLARMILTAALNIILAILITGRLLFFRRRLRRALGTSEALAVPYISIAAMVIESSMICAASYLALAIPYALNSHAANIFLPSSFLMPVLSTILISMRVASRRAWDSRTMTVMPSDLTSPRRAVSSMEFTVATVEGLETCAVVEEVDSPSSDSRGMLEMNIMRRIVGVLEDGAQHETDKK